jgi:hypothetical protein
MFSQLYHCYTCLQDNQKDLEHATEQLSEYLERDISSDIAADMKQKVQDKYRFAIQRSAIRCSCVLLDSYWAPNKLEYELLACSCYDMKS